MKLLRKSALAEIDATERPTSRIESAEYRKSFLERLETIRFFRHYYSGEIYRHRADWIRGNSYSPSLETPSIYVNYARYVVDKLATTAFGAVQGIRLGEELIPVRSSKATTLELSQAGRFLSRFLASTKFLNELAGICREVLITGDCALKLYFTPHTSFPLSFTVIAAESFDFEHEPDDLSRIQFLHEEYSFPEGEKAIRIRREDTYEDKVVIYKDLVRARFRNPVLSRLLGNHSYLMFPSLPAAVERVLQNPFGFIPFVHLANRRPRGEKFGVSELKDITTILDDINYKVSQRSRNISRTMNAIIKNINGRLIYDRFDDTQIISVIGDGAELDYLVNSSNLEPVEAHISWLKQALTDLTGVIMLSPEKLTSIGPMSGFALSILYEPLLHAARAKRAELGTKIEEFLGMVIRAGLALGYIKGEDNFAQPSLVYAPDLQFTEEEKLTRLKRLILAKKSLPADEISLIAMND